MKTSRIHLLAVVFSISARVLVLAQGTLADGSFESGALVLGGTNGWTTLSGTVALSQGHAKTGTRSLEADYGFTIPTASMVYQWVPVQPRVTYSLQGWAMTPIALDPGRDGYMYLQFADANHTSIAGAGASTAYIKYGSPVNTWISLAATATAPANAAYVRITAGMGIPPGYFIKGGAVYFDNVSFGKVPEPSSATLLGLAGLLGFRRRK